VEIIEDAGGDAWGSLEMRGLRRCMIYNELTLYVQLNNDIYERAGDQMGMLGYLISLEKRLNI
jgi:hypothetical protein